jgi:hemoglobin
MRAARRGVRKLSLRGRWIRSSLGAIERGRIHWDRFAPAGFKYLVTEMLCWAAGGPQKYTGRSMKDSHRDLMITAVEWDAFLDDLRQTLDKFAVPQAEQAEIKAIVDSTRADIVV